MTVPVVQALAKQYPDDTISFLSKPFHSFLFDPIANVSFIAFDEKKHKGLWGTFLFWWKYLRPLNFTHVVDLHDVLRSKILRSLFAVTAAKVGVFEKGRTEKKQAVHAHTAARQPLKHTVQRYKEAFGKLGFKVDLDEQHLISAKRGTATVKIIGIAPFAKHFTKTYPLEKMRALIVSLLQQKDREIILFGGKEDLPQLQSLLVSEQVSIVKAQDMAGEMQQIAQLDVMISMDSANMHLASLMEVPVVSIWGGTHPNLGFYGFRQDPKQAVQVDLPCRPCSVFGRGDCPEGHFGCMKNIDNQEIVEKIANLIASRESGEID